MQFSTSEEHVQLVERAKALLARSKPGLMLGELHLQAMRFVGGEPREAKVRDHGPTTKARSLSAGATASSLALES
jgi:hypothetical protein